ncbi:hypothetical protein B9T31_16315 [Acinetobacter sp. ANC 4558]|nr:hypothetical protein B9T31_16315 [Acinetobacter sp. ANC 4558]
MRKQSLLSEKYALNLVKIEQGIVEIKKRYHRLDLFMICTGTIFLGCLISLYLQQDFVYSFFGLTTEVKQLHVPISANGSLSNLQTSPDYFLNLLSWFGWFITKLLISFVGSFYFLRWAKRIHFFIIRFKSLVLRCIAWLIAFIMILSVLTYIQNDRRDNKIGVFTQEIAYNEDIQQSKIAQYLKKSNLDPNVQAYLLAQTALIHQPVDKDAAIPYILKLINAEKQNDNFIQYGFKPEQLWTMQYQLYEKALTPLAKSVEKQAKQAEDIQVFVQYFIILLSFISAILTIILFFLSHHLKKRILRIEHRLR